MRVCECVCARARVRACSIARVYPLYRFTFICRPVETIN
jgi:hypothetical protein